VNDEKTDVDVDAIAQALAQPFDPLEVKFKPATVSGNRALALPFVDARVIQDRLDEVLGVMGWQDAYERLPDGAVVCRLSVKIGGEWITKEDVGGQSEQPDEGDRAKAAFCLPLDAQALTPSGWTSHYQLLPGDLILGYDLEDSLCRWTPARAVNVFPKPQEVIQMSSKSFNVACTPAHRWVVHRRGVGVLLKPTDQLDARDRIVVAAPAEAGSHRLTAREAAIIGWLSTDGSVTQSPDRRPGRLAPQFHAFIHQSKVFNREAIRLLVGQDAVEHVTPAGARTFPGHESPSATLERAAFRLRTGFARRLLSRAGLYDGAGVDWRRLVGLVTCLSGEARAAMFDAMMAGDGQHACPGQRKFGKKRKPGVMDAFEVLATLQGIALGTLHSSDEPGSVPLRTLRKNPHTWSKCIQATPAKSQAVWCPSTELGTWIARWNGQITITGNSDALKRAAVKFGIGRYLYRQKSQWVDYDPQKRQFLRQPQLAQQQPTHAPARPQAKAQPLVVRVGNFENRLVGKGLCCPGDLLAWLAKMCGDGWAKAPDADVEAACREFEQTCKAGARP
jgi:hypothetical protein